METTTVHPYERALEAIERHPGCGGTISLCKLALSLYNPAVCYSVAECLCNLDDPNTRLALEMVAEFAAHGETETLRILGRAVYARYPHLWREYPEKKRRNRKQSR